jgi:LysM repeat protein
LAYKICPICGARAHANAVLCATCGASLSDVATVAQRERRPSGDVYQAQYGETDLREGVVQRRGASLAFIILVTLLLSACAALVLIPAALVLRSTGPAQPSITPAGSEAPETPLLIISTATAFPTLALSTVTPAPPSATATPTPGPCERVVGPGDTLGVIIYACGHLSMDVLPLVLELNNLSAPEALQVGQTIFVPLPTPTFNPSQPPAASSSNSGVEVAAAPAENATPTPFLPPTPTLMPGLAWYVVQPNDNMISIMFEFRTTAEVLAQINPEVPFSQCDFQFDTGGPRCTVLLQPGQQFRVPAPSPTPTLSPTPSGSETATPTPTATFNAPSPISPNNRALFRADEIITLRWVTTGMLEPGERYRVTLRDLTADLQFEIETDQLFVLVPADWQGADARRHEYQWTVSVVNADRPGELRYTTEPQIFSWEGRGDTP